jgi:uncharacterized membrane protein
VSRFVTVDIQEIQRSITADPVRIMWRAAWTMLIATILSCGTVVVIGFIAPSAIPANAAPFLSVGLLAIPPTVWFLTTERVKADIEVATGSEYSVTFVLSAIATSAVVLPVLDLVISPAEWLSRESTLTRITGFTLTTAVWLEAAKYLLVRWRAWDVYDEPFRAIMHTVSVALGSAAALSVVQLITYNSTPTAFALRVLANNVIGLIASLIISYGLVRSRRGEAGIWLLPVVFIAACLLTGIVLTFRSGLLNGQLGLLGAVPRPLFAFGFVVAYCVAGMAFVRFIYTNMQRTWALTKNELED